jgi:hypothetical protein
MLISVSDILSKSWSQYIKHWHHWAVFSLLLFLPTFILTVSGAIGLFLDLYAPATTFFSNIIILIMFLLSLFLAFWGSLALTHAGVRLVENNKTNLWKEHFAATSQLVLPALVASFFTVVTITFGLALFFIPGLIFSVWFFFALFEVVSNKVDPFKALVDSKKLVRGRWWSVAWRIAVPFSAITLLLAAAMFIAGLPVAIFFSDGNSEPIFYLVLNILFPLIISLFAPWFTLAGLNLYYSLRENPFRELPALLSGELPND